MDIKTKRIIASVPIHSVNPETKIPAGEGFGTGCVINYKDNFIFLTVRHVIEDKFLLTGIVADFTMAEGVKLLPLDDMLFLIKGDFSQDQNFGDLSSVDFAYKRLEDKPSYKYFQTSIDGRVDKCDRIILDSNLDESPDEKEEYGFFGLTYPTEGGNPIVGAKFQTLLSQECAYYDGLVYKGEVGDFYIFSLPNKDYEDSDFRGTSGAPILDSKGRLVALVSCGGVGINPEEWIVYGVSIKKFKTPIEIECGLIK